VSIVVPCYNGRRFLRECLDSAVAVAQPTWEILVVDDGSTEAIRDLVEGYAPRVAYLRQDNLGLAAARNSGLRETTGRYLKFLDCDDYLLQNATFDRQVAVMDLHPSVGLAYGQALKVDLLRRPIGRRRPPFTTGSYLRTGEAELRDLLFANYITASSALVRRTALEQVGGFNPAYRTIAEDWDCWLRLAPDWSFAYLDDLAVGYRIHGETVSSRQRVEDFLARHAEILERVFADPWYSSRFGKIRPAVESYQYVLAAWVAYGAHQRGLARAYGLKVLPVALRHGDWRITQEACTVLAKTSLPAALHRPLQSAIRQARRVRRSSRSAGPRLEPEDPGLIVREVSA
jgi:glycosyltransferase involved in cell wall biosynthesis